MYCGSGSCPRHHDLLLSVPKVEARHRPFSNGFVVVVNLPLEVSDVPLEAASGRRVFPVRVPQMPLSDGVGDEGSVFCQSSGTVGVVSGMAAVDPGIMVFSCCMPSRNGKRPVIRALRVGEHTGWAWLFARITPCEANACVFFMGMSGDETSGFSIESAYPQSSIIIITMALGAGVAVDMVAVASRSSAEAARLNIVVHVRVFLCGVTRV